MKKEPSMTLLHYLFNPKTIALIGASHAEEKLGGVILKNLLRFKGRVYPVNPKYTELMGLKAYHSLAEIPESIDLSVIVRPASEMPLILREHKDRARCAIIVSAGFAEIGEDKLQEEIKNVARDIGVRILGPNCMGVYNPYRKLDTFFLSTGRLKRPKKGNVAIVSQSGAILTCLFEAMRTEKIGISKAVNYGNAADLNESDLYEYLTNDESSDVVISYIESLVDGRRFIETARVLSEKKSFIILKSGKGLTGQAAAYSHTGRLAGRYEVFSSILRQFGIKEAKDFDELVDAVKSISSQKPLKGNRVLIITDGGGSGVLAVDECMRQGLRVAELSENRIRKLRDTFPHFYTIDNPLDLTAQVRDEDYIVALNELKDDYDGFIVIALTGVMGITEKLGVLMTNSKENIKKPIVFHIAHDGLSRKLIATLKKAGIPAYPSPERAVRGLRALLN